MLPTHAYCPNCQRTREVERVRSQHLFDVKKSQIKLKCCECGYVAGVKRTRKNPVKKYKPQVGDKVKIENGVGMGDIGTITEIDSHRSKLVVHVPSTGYSATKDHITFFDYVSPIVKKTRKKRNYPKKASPVVHDFRGPVKKGKRTIIYDRILKIEAQKGDKSLWPRDLFVHKFTGKDAEILGNPDGSLLVKSKSGKKLWKAIDYKKRDIR